MALIGRAPRIDLEMLVELSFGDSEEVFVGNSVNISETGMLVLSDEVRPLGTLVSFEFGPRFKGQSEVIWSREAEDGRTLLGMRFHLRCPVDWTPTATTCRSPTPTRYARPGSVS